MMPDKELVAFLQWALPRLRLRWKGFRKVRRQVGKRLSRRLAEVKLQTLNQYRARLEENPEEWRVFDGLCHITISCLYRDKRVFDALGTRVFPELAEAAHAQNRPVRCWCAGCACGEEVYTLKILWEFDISRKPPGVRLEIIGTDADAAVLRRAEKGCFHASSLHNVPPHWRQKAFALNDDRYCVRAQYRDGLDFRRQDIRVELPAGPFDLILCRNLVFTYFEVEQQREITHRIAESLRDNGYLVIGAHETPPENDHIFTPCGEREILRKTQEFCNSQSAGCLR